MAKLLSRTEVLGNLRGRHTKQASTLLTLIENRTAYQLAESQQAAAGYPPATTSHARAQSYLEAIAQGRERTHQPTIRDLERYASTWVELVPESAPLRATVTHLLGANYRFTRRVTPGIHAALGLATPAVQQAYQQQYAQPLASIYIPRLGLIEQGRWFWARLAGWLENLSPFWTAFALTLTETVGASTLALPIALAGVGPLAGVGLIIGLGLINLLTMAGLVEAIVRNGNMRYGHSYFGQLVHDYPGRIGAVVFTSALLLLVFLLLLAYYTGFATALAETTHRPATLWAGLRMTPGGGGKANFQLVAQGQPLTATVQIRKSQGQEERRAAHGEIANSNQLIALSFQLPASAATLLKVWTHSVSVEGDAVGLSTQVTVNGAGQSSHVAHTTRATQGQLTIPINGAACQVEIVFERGKE